RDWSVTGVQTCALPICRALGDSREDPRFVATVPGRGYQLVAPVHTLKIEAEAAGSTPSSSEGAGDNRRAPRGALKLGRGGAAAKIGRASCRGGVEGGAG